MEQPDFRANKPSWLRRQMDLPAGWRLVLVFLVAVIYAVAFPVLIAWFGNPAAFFSLMIVVLMGLMFGVAGGLLGGLLTAGLTLYLFQVHAGVQPLDVLKHWGAGGTILLLVVGFLAGGLRRLQKRLEEDQAANTRTARQVEEKLQLESLASEVSRSFIHVPLEDVETHLRSTLEKLGQFAHADRVHLHLVSRDGRTIAEQYEWWQSGQVEAVFPPVDNLNFFHWTMTRLRRLEVISILDVNQLPGEAAPERNLWAEMGERSLLIVPISVQDRLAGYLGVSSRSDIRRWTEEDIHLVRMVGDLLARLLDHREHLHLMKQQEQRLRDIFGGAGVGMAVTDPSGVILEANRQMEELLGYQPGDLVGLSMQALTHPGDYPRERDLIRSIPLSCDEPVLFEKRLVRKNGEMIWVRSTVSFIRDEHRQPRLTIGTVEDISNRKQSESDLHQRQAILEAVAAAAERFLAVEDWEKSIQAAIEALGWATNASRVMIHEVRTEANGRVSPTGRYSWTAPGMSRSRGMNLDPDTLFSESGFRNWAPRLRKNIPVRAERQDFPDAPVMQAIHSILLVPIFVDGSWWGVISLEDQINERQWTDGEQEALRVAAGVMGMAVQHRRIQRQIQQLYEAEHQARKLAEGLTASAASLNASLQTDAVLDHILSHLAELLPHDAANIMLVEEGQAKVHRLYGYSQEEMHLPVMHQALAVHQSPWLERAASTRHPVIVSDAQAESGANGNGALKWIRSFCVIPVVHSDRVIGFINLHSTHAGTYHAGQVEIMEAFADQAALALQNAWLYEQSQENARQIAMLNQISRAAIGASSLVEMLEIFVNGLGDVFHMDGAYLTLWDEAHQRPIPMASSSDPDRAYSRTAIIPNENTLTASVLEAGHLLAVEDAEKSPYISPRIAMQFNEKSLLGLPLIVGGKKLGALILGYHQAHHFRREELALAEQAANQIALAVAKEQLLEMEKTRTHQLMRANNFISLLNHIATRVESAGTLNDVLSMLGSDLLTMGLRCMVALRNSNPELLVEYYTYEQDLPALLEGYNPAIGEYIRLIMDREQLVKKVLNERKPFFIRNMLDLAEDGLAMCPSDLAAALFYQAGLTADTRLFLMPLVVKEQAVGVLAIWGEDVLEDDLSVLSTFASQTAAAIHNARLYEEIQRLASTDDLTGLLNHRGLFERGRDEVERALRFGRPLSAIMMDIDYFKKFNDLYSHIVGNEILVMLGQRCRQSVRDLDMVARYGGDEICILLIEGDAVTAVRVAERIRRSVADTPFECSAGQTQVTVSLGVATMNPTGDSLEQLIERADRALNHAKRQGRNRVVVR